MLISPCRSARSVASLKSPPSVCFGCDLPVRSVIFMSVSGAPTSTPRSSVSFSTVSTRFCQFEASSSVGKPCLLPSLYLSATAPTANELPHNVSAAQMPHTLDGGGDGFLVKYASLAESDINAESVLYLSCQYLRLHFAHQPNLQFLQFFRPNGTQRRVFLGKFEQFRVKQPRRAIVRQNHFVRQNGFEQGCFSVLFRSESLSRIRRRKPVTAHISPA